MNCGRHRDEDAVLCEVTSAVGERCMLVLCSRCIQDLRHRGATVLVMPKEVDDEG